MATDPSLEWSPTPAGGSQRTPASLCLALGILYRALLRVCVAWPLRCVSAWQGLLLPPLSCPPAFCGCQRRRTTPSSFPGIFFVIWLEKPAVPFSSLKAPSGPPTHWQRGRISPHPAPGVQGAPETGTAFLPSGSRTRCGVRRPPTPPYAHRTSAYIPLPQPLPIAGTGPQGVVLALASTGGLCAWLDVAYKRWAVQEGPQVDARRRFLAMFESDSILFSVWQLPF